MGPRFREDDSEKDREAMMTNVKSATAFAALACALAASTTMACAADVTFERLRHPEPMNWLMNHGDFSAHRFSALDKINMLASDQAEAQRNNFADQLLAQDRAARAPSPPPPALLAPRVQVIQPPYQTGAGDPLNYVSPAPSRGASNRPPAKQPPAQGQNIMPRSAPIIMPH